LTLWVVNWKWLFFFWCFAMGLGGVVVLGDGRDGILVRGLFCFWGLGLEMASSWVWQGKDGEYQNEIDIGQVILY